jgi:hypothetical protein
VHQVTAARRAVEGAVERMEKALADVEASDGNAAAQRVFDQAPSC